MIYYIVTVILQVVDLQNRALLVIIWWKVRKIRSEEEYVNNRDTLPTPSIAEKKLSAEILPIQRILKKFMYIQNNDDPGKL